MCGIAALNVAALSWISGSSAAVQQVNVINDDVEQVTAVEQPAAVSDYSTLPAAVHIQKIAQQGLAYLGDVTVKQNAVWPTWCSLPTPDAVIHRAATAVTNQATWTLHVAATGAGQGAAWWENMLAVSCPTATGPAAVQLTSLQPQQPFITDQTQVISVSVNGDALRSTVWRQGDVAFFLIRTLNNDSSIDPGSPQASSNQPPTIDSSTGVNVTGDSDVATPETWDADDSVALSSYESESIEQVQRQVAAQADDLLTGVCVDRSMGRNVNDQGRNPYRPDYRGLRVPVTVPTPTVPAGLTIPQVPQPPASQWFPPADATPQAVPELAPVLAGQPGDDPNVDAAPRGPAPVLLDPSALGPAPVAVTYPTPPQPPTLEQVMPAPVTVPIIDVFGPGCGWDFTGMQPPMEDSRQLEQQRSDAVANYTLALAQTQTQWLASLYDYDAQVQQWLPAAQAWVNYQAYVNAVDSVQQQWNAARDTYNQSVDLWRESVTVVDDVTGDDTTVEPGPGSDANDPNDPNAGDGSPGDVTVPESPDGPPQSQQPSPQPSPQLSSPGGQSGRQGGSGDSGTAP